MGIPLFISRDPLYDLLKENNILSRRYFYTLILEFSTHHNLRIASDVKLPNGKQTGVTGSLFVYLP